MPSQKRRAVIYTRISLDRDGTSDSPQRQEYVCRQLAEQRGFDVVSVEEDRDVAGWNVLPRLR